MTQERIVYLNGEIIPESEAKISVRDRGFVYGDAVFDTTRTFNGRIFKLQDHLDRFFNSLKYLRMEPGLSKQQFADITMQVLEANLPLLEEGGDYWVTQRITRGVPGGSPTVLVECVPLPFDARAKFYRDGMPVIVPSIRRTPPEAMSPRAKMHNYINLVLATQEVEAQNPDAWPILLDMQGNLCGGTRREHLPSQGRRGSDAARAVCPSGHQPRDGDRPGTRTRHQRARSRPRPVRRLHRRRSLHHIHQLLHRAGVVVQRQHDWRRGYTGAGDAATDAGLQRDGRRGHSGAIPGAPEIDAIEKYLITNI